MSDLHVLDVQDAYPLGRDALVAETKTLHADFAATTWADSRLKVDQAGVLELLRGSASTFAIVPLGESIQCVRVEGAAEIRLVRLSYLFVLAQWVTDGDGEDLYFRRTARFVLGWGARDTFTFNIEGTVGGREIPFLVSVEEAAPLTLDTDSAGDVHGHATTQRIVLEVEACAA
jgi:hypothetical protein